MSIAERDIRNQITTGLTSFLGDYGPPRLIKCVDGFAFGLRGPIEPFPLATWSIWEEDGCVCFIEGVLYDAYECYVPRDGEDPNLARLILKQFKRSRDKAIEKLSGAFSEFVYESKSNQLSTFVDRLGIRVLYWSCLGGKLFVSSCLVAVGRLRHSRIDQTGAFQYLTIGFPIGDRTLLSDIRIQLPSTINRYSGGKATTHRYWRVPDRHGRLTLRDFVTNIVESQEQLVSRISRRVTTPLALGTSGGHDSRVVLSSLAYTKTPFRPMMWKEGNFNDCVAQRLCSTVGKEIETTRSFSSTELLEMKRASFLSSDGSYYHLTGFLKLAKACQEQRMECLLLGFSGGRISGGLTIPSPERLRSLEQLSQCALEMQMKTLSFADAYVAMDGAKAEFVEASLHEWKESFLAESATEYLSDVALWQVLSNRNLKRIRFQMITAAKYVQLIFPYLDSAVMHAYFSLPIDFLKHQKAHCYAAFHRFRQFGDHQTTGYPISLKLEAKIPSILYGLRMSAQIQRFLSRLNGPSRFKGDWSTWHVTLKNETMECPLFNKTALNKLFVNKRIRPAELYKMHTLSKFYELYAGQNPS